MRCETTLSLIVESSGNRIIRFITSCVAVKIILWELSFRVLPISRVSPILILIVGRSICTPTTIISIEWLVWASIKWFSIVWFVFPVCGVWPRREFLTGRWAVLHMSVFSVILVPSMKNLTSSSFFLIYGLVLVPCYSLGWRWLSFQ